MIELELTRTPGERRLYALERIGSLRFEGLLGRRATAEAGRSRWQFDRHGFWRRAMRATDAAGAVVGEFEPRRLRRGGTLHWAGRELTLRPASHWRERYALVADDRELAILDGKGWGRRPVTVMAEAPNAIEPGLLLFAAFVVRALAEDAQSDAAAATTAATAGG